ncbi:type III pantothenate kinase [Flavobacterium sp.]|uniref:type III pantothenate kinase n=1 Tax=Flavobacterium sp. TaxID=239 RepID=UPI0026282077|nr:type III pantothenate kinase [Flavobacterium sp.]
MHLVIDVGNTQIKAAVFEHNTLLKKEIIGYDNWKDDLKKIINFFQKIDFLVVSSVGKLEKEDFLSFNPDLKVYFISRDINFPFNNLYASPATLGIDRMVLAAGAVLQFPNKNRLIIDAGTCITYDFVDSNDNYLGGAIAPGIRLRYESLHNYTAKLPLLKKESPTNIIGNSTIQSIHSGVINGVSFEIDGFVNSFLNENDNFIIILTGGDTDFLAERLKNTIFANPNFLLESLNQTFQYNNND